MRLTFKLTAALLAMLALGACAQQAAPPPPPPPPPAVAPPPPPPPAPTVNLRGRIVSLHGQILKIHTREGKTVMVVLAPNSAVRVLKRKKLGDIKQGDYIASTSMPGKDGKLHAVEIHYLPPAAPELQVPYDLAPQSVMTNAHVNGMAAGKNGTDLTVTYKGTQTDIIVDHRTVIVTNADGSMQDLRPGKAVFLRVTKDADGNYATNNVTVEKNGVKPPM